MTHHLDIRKVELSEAAILLELSKRTFFDAFASRNRSEDIEAYGSVNFTLPKVEAELTHPYSCFYFAVYDNEIAGYIKLNTGPAQTEFQGDRSLEVERIYIAAQHQGKKLGEQLINFAMTTAKESLCEYIWLGVWEKNYDAIRFYERLGFIRFSSHYFMLGSDKQTDILMKKSLK